MDQMISVWRNAHSEKDEQEQIRDRREQIGFLAMIFAVGGIFGFFYEEFFYRIDLGQWVKRGSTFGPWIPIYGVGALCIVFLMKYFKRQPVLQFLSSAIACGMLEYGTGWVLFHWFQTRLWDYNVEIWNWGNVGGYICFRSILFFGMSALFLQYVIVPQISKLAKKWTTGKQYIWAVMPGTLFLFDILIYALTKQRFR